MPTDVKNVSEITKNLIKIVQDNSDLQNVWIQGKISNVRHIRNGPLNFTLTDEDEKIECVIFDNGTSPQEDFPVIGSSVVVKGEIFVYGVRSEYRFKITDINLPESPLQSQPVSVTALTNTLQDTLKAHSGEVQGEISGVFVTPANYTIFKLKNINVNGLFDDIIECTLPPGVDPPFPLATGKRVHVNGQFGIFAKASAYRIEIDDANNITQVAEKPKKGKPAPNECQECGQQHDTDYELCPTCHYAQVDYEGIVVGAVLRYFKAPRFANFSTQREYSIRFGANIRGRADVGLLNSQGNPAALAECKRIGYDGSDRIEQGQLKSYLNARGTTLGLFAADTDPYEWTFIKNLGQGNFDKISRSQFERELGVEPTPTPTPTKTHLELIHGNIIESKVDAIATTANQLLTRGSGVDEAVWDAGGKEIENECQEIINRKGFRPEGDVLITTGGNLSAGHIIHAVGPIYDGKENSKADVLASCYKSSLRLAVENGIRSIAFPAISTGKNFRYPIEKATTIALKAVKEFVEQAQQNNEMVPEHIQFVLFNEEVYNCYVKEFSTLGLGLSCFIG